MGRTPFYRAEKRKNVVKETAEKEELLAMWEMGGCLTLWKGFEIDHWEVIHHEKSLVIGK